MLRLCSKPEDLGIRLDQLKEALLSRGYNPKVISGAFTKVKAITRKDALKKVEKTQRSRMVPLVITYHPTLPSIAQIVRKHWSVMIQDDFRLEKCFPAPPVVAYRRSKNLKDLLIRAKLPIGKRSGRKRGGFTKCGGFCNVCTFSESTSTHKNSKTGEVWKINTELSCKSQDVVYKIRCGKCPPFAYIGETGQQFKDRIRQHKSDINTEKDTPVANHFNLAGHTVADMIAVPIEKVMPEGNKILRLTRERLWMRRYQCVENGGNRRF